MTLKHMPTHVVTLPIAGALLDACAWVVLSVAYLTYGVLS